MTSRSRHKRKILVYAQDVGGAKFIAPVVEYIWNRYHPFVVVHPLAEAVFKKYEISYHLLLDLFGQSSPKGVEIESLLMKNKVSHVFCTLSSSYRDLTNSNLIKVARELNIPTFGVLDHWKGYDRFYDRDGYMSYFPDFIGCIDEFCESELLKICPDPQRIFIVGHPHLERFSNIRTSIKKKTSTTINILIISQPDTKDIDFRSIFLTKGNFKTIFDRILEDVGKITERNITIKYRPHPKEKNFGQLPEGIYVDRTEDWEEVLLKNDIFIGLDSMLLIEAHLAGKYCILLNIPEFCCVSDKAVPYQIGEKVSSLQEIGFVLHKAIQMLNHDYLPDLSDIDRKMADSLKRTAYYFEQFINKRVNVCEHSQI